MLFPRLIRPVLVQSHRLIQHDYEVFKLAIHLCNLVLQFQYWVPRGLLYDSSLEIIYGYLLPQLGLNVILVQHCFADLGLQVNQ